MNTCSSHCARRVASEEAGLCHWPSRVLFGQLRTGVTEPGPPPDSVSAENNFHLGQQFKEIKYFVTYEN